MGFNLRTFVFLGVCLLALIGLANAVPAAQSAITAQDPSLFRQVVPQDLQQYLPLPSNSSGNGASDKSVRVIDNNPPAAPIVLAPAPAPVVQPTNKPAVLVTAPIKPPSTAVPPTARPNPTAVPVARAAATAIPVATSPAQPPAVPASKGYLKPASFDNSWTNLTARAGLLKPNVGYIVVANVLLIQAGATQVGLRSDGNGAYTLFAADKTVLDNLSNSVYGAAVSFDSINVVANYSSGWMVANVQ